jgi:hypothetical protein
MGIVYAHDIESPLARWWEPPQVLSCHLRYFAPFVPVYRRLSGLYVARGPRLNFNKAKNICVPANQVDLAAAARRAEVSRHHRVSQLPQMEVRRFFAARASLLMPRPRVRREHVQPHPIQTIDNRSRERCGEHRLRHRGQAPTIAEKIDL